MFWTHLKNTLSSTLLILLAGFSVLFLVRSHVIQFQPAPLVLIFDLGLLVSAISFFFRVLCPKPRSTPFELLILLPGVLIGLIVLLNGFRFDSFIIYFSLLLLSFSPDFFSGYHFSFNLAVFKPQIIQSHSNEPVPNESISDKPDDGDEEREKVEANEKNENHEETENGEEEEEFADPHTIMLLTRTRNAENKDVLECTVRADFPSGERNTYAHVAFCPGFDSLPKVESYQLDGDSVQIQCAQLTLWGVRLDLKRPSQRKEEESVRIFVSAVQE